MILTLLIVGFILVSVSSLKLLARVKDLEFRSSINEINIAKVLISEFKLDLTPEKELLLISLQQKVLEEAKRRNLPIE